MKRKCLNCPNEIKKGAGKYCGHVCQQIYQYQNYIKRWLDGQENGLTGKKIIEVSNYIRKYLFEINNNSCQQCGWSEKNPITGLIPLEINHKDGDSENNKPENLELLCPNCHSLTPNYKALNKNSKRKFRMPA